MENQWICRNALSGAIPKGGSTLAVFLILQSGEERSVNKSEFRTKAAVNGSNDQKTLNTMDILFMSLPPPLPK